MLSIWLLAVAMASTTVCSPAAIALKEWSRGKTAVIVCGYGDTAPGTSDWHQTDDNTWQGENLTVLLIRNGSREVVATSGVEDSIRVAVRLPKITVTEFTSECSG